MPTGPRALVIAGVALVGAIAAVLAIGLRGGTKPSAFRLEPCTIAKLSARCGMLAVPENPSAPDGGKIELRVAVLPATGPNRRPDPLFWFAGWGGAGVSDDAANVLSALTSVNVDRDVVFIDQRGTGSSRLECGLPPDVTVTAAARRCAARAGPNFRYYTSAVAVDDFDRVRQALGYRRINIYGGSYGVTTGLIYLLRHGAHVRTAVFDSGSLLDVRIFERIAPNAQRALELLFGRCAADTACATAFPALRRDFATAQRRLTGARGQLTPATFANAVEELLAYSAGKAVLPRAIHLVATGQIGRAAALVRSAGVGSDTSELAYQHLIECSEPWAIRRPAQTRSLAAGTFYAPAAARELRLVQALCRGMPRAPVPAAIGARVRSSVPVLFLTGNEDPADPPANVAHARNELPNSRTVIFPASGHGQLGLLCAQNLIAAFVSAGTAAGLDASCAKTAVQQPFDALSGS